MTRITHTGKFSVTALFLLLTLSIADPVDAAGKGRVKQGAAAGAGIGAGIGLLLGILSGDADVAVEAMATEAAVGAGEGAYRGWREKQHDQRTQQLTDAIKSSGQPTAAADPEEGARKQLERFLGDWELRGWMREENGERVELTSRLEGRPHMSVLVELSYVDIKATSMAQQIWGTSVMGFNGQTGYSISTRFNIAPDSIDIDNGSFEIASRSFEFEEEGYRCKIKFKTPDHFTVLTTDPAGETVESYSVKRL